MHVPQFIPHGAIRDFSNDTSGFIKVKSYNMPHVPYLDSYIFTQSSIASIPSRSTVIKLTIIQRYEIDNILPVMAVSEFPGQVFAFLLVRKAINV